MAKSPLEQALETRILVIDGAMGTMIQGHQLEEADFRGERFANHGMPLKGNNDLLVLTQPEIIEGIHRQYLEAGADLIETNSFNANAVSMADYGLEEIVYELNVAAARVARAAVDAYSTEERPRFVAGVLGPTNKTASISPRVEEPEFRDISYEELVEDYCNATRGLLDGGADAILVETVFDTLNCKAALFAIAEVKAERGIDIDVLISATITDASGRTLRARPLKRSGIRCGTHSPSAWD